MIPANPLSSFEFLKKNFPNSVAVVPRAMNMKENPNVNKRVLIKILCLFATMSLRDCPAIYEIYPGINGRTQGDKKLINPAKKAIGKVAVINTLRVYYFFPISICLFAFS